MEVLLAWVALGALDEDGVDRVCVFVRVWRASERERERARARDDAILDWDVGVSHVSSFINVCACVSVGVGVGDSCRARELVSLGTSVRVLCNIDIGLEVSVR